MILFLDGSFIAITKFLAEIMVTIFDIFFKKFLKVYSKSFIFIHLTNSFIQSDLLGVWSIVFQYICFLGIKSMTWHCFTRDILMGGNVCVINSMWNQIKYFFL